jgi:hypothetical protein
VIFATGGDENMEKVKLTLEQAEAIKTFCKTYNQQYWLEIFKNNKQIPDWEHEEMRILTELSDDEFALAVCGWYEIEEPYKVGDWLYVSTPNSDFVAKVVEEESEYVGFDNGRLLSSFQFRKATPEEIAAEKERRKWAAIGRKVNEYRKGDFVKVKGEEFYGVVERPLGNDRYQVRDLHYSRSPYIDADILELICPVEHRFDMKEDE